LTSDQPVARPLLKHRKTQTQNKRIHTSNICVLCGIRTHDPSVRTNGDSSRTSLACESDSARVPMGQTRPCVGGHAHTYVVKLIRARLVRVWAVLDRAATLADHPIHRHLKR
jgi:hypothetical protein